MTNTITVSGINVLIERKDIKNLHLAVYPPDGRVRVAVPLNITNDNVRLAVISKLSWIKKRQADFKNQLRQSERDMVSGESHYLFGKRYRLEIIENSPGNRIQLSNNKMRMYVKPDTGKEKREKMLLDLYRIELKKRIPEMIQKWEQVIGKTVSAWGIRRMKTKWGSCSTGANRILINLELAKKPLECLEYIVVHEMVHLLERHHNDRFRAYLDKFLPQWELYRDMLKHSPLAHEDWSY